MKKTPDKSGHFGIYGGRYISETLMPAVMELEEAYNKWKKDGEPPDTHSNNNGEPSEAEPD